MDVKKIIESVNADLDSIVDLTVKNFVAKLINTIEALSVENEQLHVENKGLRDENNRLKCERDKTPSSASLIKTRSGS